MQPCVHTTHSHEILFMTHTYLTFAFSLINTDGRNASGKLFTRPFLPSPSRPAQVWEPTIFRQSAGRARKICSCSCILTRKPQGVTLCSYLVRVLQTMFQVRALHWGCGWRRLASKTPEVCEPVFVHLQEIRFTFCWFFSSVSHRLKTVLVTLFQG